MEEHLSFIIKDINNLLDRLAGDDYTNDMGETVQGWRGAGIDYAQNQANAAKSAVSNTANNVKNAVIINIDAAQANAEEVGQVVLDGLGDAWTSATAIVGE